MSARDIAGRVISARLPCKDGSYRLCRLCLLSIMLALEACSSAERSEQQVKIAASASQTATMVLDAWAARAVPSHYASATLQSTAEILAEAGRQMQSDISAQLSTEGAVMTAIGRLSAAARHAQAGVAADNPRRVSEARQELKAAASDLAARARLVAPKP